jgi:uncharacterized damage-inducible protein DinB
MAHSSDLLLDAFGRINESVHAALDGLSDEQLATPIAPGANTVAWLVWHINRLIDDHIADLQGVEQLWTRDGWFERYALPFDPAAIGYGQSTEEAQSVKVSGELLAAYHHAVQGFASEYVAGISDSDLDRVVDIRWDPPVTVAIRLVSVVNDCAQHVGQAAYVRGILLTP